MDPHAMTVAKSTEHSSVLMHIFCVLKPRLNPHRYLFILEAFLHFLRPHLAFNEFVINVNTPFFVYREL
jgi:hypothetical protein